MPLPEFSNAEQGLIQGVKCGEQRPSVYAMAYLACGVVMAGYGFYLDSKELMLTAMLVAFGFRAYEELNQMKYLPAWKSLIAKYESAIAEADARAEKIQISK